MEYICWNPAKMDKLWRLGGLASFVARSTKNVRNLFLAIATRYTQMEDGELHRAGPLARPTPKKVLGGLFMNLAKAQALSDLDLLQYIQAVVTSKPLVQFAARVHASTNARGDGGQKAMAASTFKNILKDLGTHMPFITTEKELGQAAKNIPETEKRSVVMRAFLGGLRNRQIRSISSLRSFQMLIDATSAIAHAQDTCSVEPTLWFVSNSARKRRRTS